MVLLEAEIDPGLRAATEYATMLVLGGQDWVANTGHTQMSAEHDHMLMQADVGRGREVGKQVVGEIF